MKIKEIGEKKIWQIRAIFLTTMLCTEIIFFRIKKCKISHTCQPFLNRKFSFKSK